MSDERKMTLTMDMENAAFDESPLDETADILGSIAKKMRHGNWSGAIADANGNTIGHWEVTGV